MLCRDAEALLVGHTVSHDDKERLDLAFGDEVVHDEVGMALVPPGILVLTPAMLHVEDGELGFLLGGVVGRRDIDEGAAHLLGALGPEQDLLDSSVRDIAALLVEGTVMGGNLDTALPTGRTVVVVRTGIVDDTAVNRQVIIMEALIHGTRSGSHPVTVVVLMKDGAAGTAKAEAHDD